MGLPLPPPDTLMTPYRQNFTPERAQAGAYMALVALALWIVALPALVYVTG